MPRRDVTVGGCRLIEGDCRDALKAIPDGSLDACVTDPPYEIGFMGKAFDRTGIAYSVPLWRGVLRVLKPGAYLAAFGSTRTYHRLACAIEDAGFEIRDSILSMHGEGGVPGAAWCYSAGFPKHRNALKPSWEPIVLARKPLSEPSVAANVLTHGTGALNVDACRVATDERAKPPAAPRREDRENWRFAAGGSGGGATHDAGRWPPNTLHDNSPEVLAAFAAFGERRNGGPDATAGTAIRNDVYNTGWKRGSKRYAGDTGTAARFFPALGFEPGELRFWYSGKAATAERDYGLDGLPLQVDETCAHGMKLERWPDGTLRERVNPPASRRNTGPCVKPVALMQWLCKLIVPVNGTLIDPFMGTGSTLVAASRLGMKAIGIEKEDEYYTIALSRLRNDAPLLTAAAVESTDGAAAAEPAQPGLFDEAAA